MDRESRLAAAKKKLNTYKKQHEQSNNSSIGTNGSFVPSSPPIQKENGGPPENHRQPLPPLEIHQTNMPSAIYQPHLQQSSQQHSPANSTASSKSLVENETAAAWKSPEHLPSTEPNFSVVIPIPHEPAPVNDLSLSESQVSNHSISTSIFTPVFPATTDDGSFQPINTLIAVADQTPCSVPLTSSSMPLEVENMASSSLITNEVQQSQSEQERELIDSVNLQQPCPSSPSSPSQLNSEDKNNFFNQTEPNSLQEPIVEQDRQQSLNRKSYSDAIPALAYPTPTFRRSNNKSPGAFRNIDGDNEKALTSALDNMAANTITTEVYELQISQLRSDNQRLLNEKNSLANHLQDVEQTIQALRNERDQLKGELALIGEDAPTLKHQLASLYDYNARLKEEVAQLENLLKQAHDKVNAKTQSYNDMEEAFSVVNQGKMELAAKLDLESELCKDLKTKFEESQREITRLSQRNVELEVIISSQGPQIERLSGMDAELVLLRKELAETNAKLGSNFHDHGDHVHHEHCSHSSRRSSQPEQEIHDGDQQQRSLMMDNFQHEQENHNQNLEDGHENEHSSHTHSHGQEDDTHVHEKHEHQHDGSQCSGHSHSHSHDHGDHSHEKHEDHQHPQHEHEGHSHSHNHDHQHSESSSSKQPSAMQKKLARLEWENAAFREELDRLAEQLKTKIADENLVQTFKAENLRLKADLNRVEHLVVQLQGENDTIGDYIALYQTQRLALKERAREKENELASLTIEREKLRSQMEQLNQLLQSYHCKLEEGTAGNEIETNAKQINELVLGINSSLFHPCAVCSTSRLMNV